MIHLSSQVKGDVAYKAIDGDETSKWHIHFNDHEPKNPHTIVVDMNDTYQVEEFIYIPRSDGENGRAWTSVAELDITASSK